MEEIDEEELERRYREVHELFQNTLEYQLEKEYADLHNLQLLERAGHITLEKD